MKVFKREDCKNLSLANFISGRFQVDNNYQTIVGVELTEADKDELTQLLGKHCRYATKRRLRSCLDNLYQLGNYGLFERVVYVHGIGWQYIAGQDYPSEIATVRKLIIEG